MAVGGACPYRLAVPFKAAMPTLPPPHSGWDLGFKSLTVENHLDLDPTMEFLGGSGDDWASEFLAVQLHDSVPREVRRLFAVARGVLLYGCFFYPLYALGHAQIHRVAEAAVLHKCQSMGDGRKRKFRPALDWLIKRGVIPEADRTKWDLAVGVRDTTSHPKDQYQLPPGFALTILKGTAQDINRLFA